MNFKKEHTLGACAAQPALSVVFVSVASVGFNMAAFCTFPALCLQKSRHRCSLRTVLRLMVWK